MKWLFSFFVLFVVLVAGVLIAPGFMDWSRYKAQATNTIANLTGLEVKVGGDVSVAFLPMPRFYLADVEILDPVTKGQVLASFKRLDVRLSLAALFGGRVEVDALHLEQPRVRALQDSQGRFNFMTDRLEALMSVEQGRSQGGSDFSVSFDRVSVQDGSFFYKVSGGKPVEVQDVNMVLKVANLKGPFEGKGSFLYGGQKVVFDLKTGDVDFETLSTRLNLKAGLEALQLDFAGVVGGGEKPEAQGEVSVRIPDLETLTGNKALKGGARVQGFVTAGAEQAVLKDVVIGVLGQDLKGSVTVGWKPSLQVRGALEGTKPLDLDPFLSAGGQGGGLSVRDLSAFLPAGPVLPDVSALDLSFGFPEALYRHERFEGVRFDLSKSGQVLSLKVAVDNLPGQGPAQLELALAQGGAPEARVDLKAQTRNAPFTVQALTGLSGLPVLSGHKTGIVDLQARLNKQGVFLDEGVVNLDKDAFAVKGSLRGQKGSSSDLLKLSLVADTVDFDNFLSSGGGSGGGDMALPFDMGLDATIHKLQMTGQLLKGVRISVFLKDKALVLNKLAADDFAGQKFNVDGTVRIDMTGPKPRLSGDVSLGDLVWKNPSIQAQTKAGGGKWPDTPLSTGWLEMMDLDLGVGARSLNYEGWLLQKPSLKAVMKGGRLDIPSLKAGLYGGQIEASGSITTQAAGVDLQGKAEISGVDMEPLVKTLAGNRLVKGSGRVNLSTDLTGSGRSMKALVGALKGQGTVSGSNIVLEGLDVNRFARALADNAKPGDTLLHLWKGAGSGGSTQFDTLDGAYTVGGGVVNIQKLLLDGPRAAIDTTGRINLLPWTIKTAHKITVKDRDDVPPFTVNIEGPLDNPTQTFAQGALNDYLSRKIQRKLDKVLNQALEKKLGGEPALQGVLKGILGGGSGSPAPAEPAPQQPPPANDNNPPAQEEQPQQEQPSAPAPVTPEDAVKDLLKGFLR